MKLNNERGSVIIVALIMLVLLTLIGVASTKMASTEIAISGNHYQSTKAFYVAESGAYLVMSNLKNRMSEYKSDWNAIPNPLVVTNEEYALPDMQFSVVITPKRNDAGNVILWGDTNNDATCEENLTEGYPIVKLTSTGISNGAVAVVEILTRLDIVFNKVPAPLYGTEGIDTGPSTTPNSIRALGGNNDTGVWLNANDCPDVNVTGIRDVISPVDAPVDLTLNDMTSEHVCAKKVCGATQDWAKGPSYPIAQTIANRKGSAQRLTTPLKSSDPTYVDLNNAQLGFNTSGEPDPGIFYCDKNLELTGNTIIHGILMVEGDLVLKGNVQIYGIVLVKGVSVVDGTGTMGVYGSFMGHNPITLNGGADFVYDCRALQELNNKYQQYRMFAWREKD